MARTITTPTVVPAAGACDPLHPVAALGSVYHEVHAAPNVHKALKEARDAERERERRERRVQRARESVGRSRRLYGGTSEEFPTYGAFHAFIYARDELTCFVCGDPGCGPLELAHLVWRVQGKRVTSTVNFPWNAVTAGQKCARRTDVDKALCGGLVLRLAERYGYEVPPEVLG